WRRNVFRKNGLIFTCVPTRQVLRERDNQQHSQGPNIARGFIFAPSDFGRVVITALSWRADPLTAPRNSVAREFQLIADGHDIRRLQTAVYETLAVQIRERFHSGLEHLANLGRR